MKKVNVILSVMLALVIMFNVGVILYNKGYDEGYVQCFEEDLNQFDESYECGYEDGVQAWSDHVESQKQLKIKNDLKNVVKEIVVNVNSKEEEL